MVLSIIKGRLPAVIARSARGVRDTQRVWGVGFGQLKGQARNRWTGSEHAARKDLMILKVTSLIWNTNAALSR
jgi:hypothetical protein